MPAIFLKNSDFFLDHAWTHYTILRGRAVQKQWDGGFAKKLFQGTLPLLFPEKRRRPGGLPERLVK
jgi:hypothetical protein